MAGFIGTPAMNFLPARRAGQRVEYPGGSAAADRLPAETGDALLIGFRPEHLQLLDRGAGDSRGLRFAAPVAVKEWLGAELILYVDIPLGRFSGAGGGERSGVERNGAATAKLTARVDRACGVAEGEEVTLGVAPDKLLFFDPASGDRLG